MTDLNDDLPESVLVRAQKASESIIQVVQPNLVYEREYSCFKKWMDKYSVHKINETVLLGYFQQLSESYSPNSLWTKFSMLRKQLTVEKLIETSEKFPQVQEYLKQLTKGYQPRKSQVLNREQVLQFLKQAPDDTYLMIKVALLMGVFGACRRHELLKMRFCDVQDRNDFIMVNISSTKTNKARNFMIVEENEMSAINLIRKYMSWRPKNAPNDRFFLCQRNNKCTAQPVGKNTLGMIPFKIAKFLNLENPRDFTGHCLRRTSATLLSEAGGGTTELRQLGAWKSASIARPYMDGSLHAQEENARLIAGCQTGTTSEEVTGVQRNEEVTNSTENSTDTSTSAMGNHLKKKHPEEFQAIVKDKVVETSPFHYVVIDPILTSSIKQECDDPEEEEEEYSENKTHINDSSNDFEETSRDTTTDVHKKRKFVDSTPPQKKQISESSYTMEVLKCMKTLTETMAKRDEYSIYGEHIANKLRNSCRSEVEIAIAQHEIDNICYKLTMGEYSQMADNQASSSGVFIKQSPTISEYSPTLSEHSPTM